MKLSPLHASLMTLALFAAGQAHAAQTSPEPVRLAQAETGATADFDAVTKFLAGTQDVSRLDEDKLQQRLKRARKLQETEGLPPDLDQALQQRIAELEAEVARRSEAAQQAPAPEAQPQAEQPAPEPQPEPQQQAEQPSPTRRAPVEAGLGSPLGRRGADFRLAGIRHLECTSTVGRHLPGSGIH